jgi:hypothetical protein
MARRVYHLLLHFPFLTPRRPERSIVSKETFWRARRTLDASGGQARVTLGARPPRSCCTQAGSQTLRYLIEWNESRLRKVLRVSHHDHAAPGAPLSAIFRSHPPILAHHRQLAALPHPDIRAARPRSFEEQLERERRRELHVLEGRRHRIGAQFDRHLAE